MRKLVVAGLTKVGIFGCFFEADWDPNIDRHVEKNGMPEKDNHEKSC